MELFDPIGLHVDQASATAASLPEDERFTAEVGDARTVQRPDGYAHVVLLLGPIYHLVERADRRLALGEAMRVLRPGELMAVAGVSRWVLLLEAYRRRLEFDERTRRMIDQTIDTGTSVEEPGEAAFHAHFHRPGKLAEEVEESGFVDVAVYAVEGFGWTLPDLADVLADPLARAHLFDVLRRVEHEPGLSGATGHVLVVATRP